MPNSPRVHFTSLWREVKTYTRTQHAQLFKCMFDPAPSGIFLQVLIGLCKDLVWLCSKRKSAVESGKCQAECTTCTTSSQSASELPPETRGSQETSLAPLFQKLQNAPLWKSALGDVTKGANASLRALASCYLSISKRGKSPTKRSLEREAETEPFCRRL